LGRFIDRTGARYGRLVVKGLDATRPTAANGRRIYWICRCDCGAEKSVTGHQLQSGDTQSCGCARRELHSNRLATHRLSASPTYRSWQAAKDRCINPRNVKFPAYGGAGVRMCSRWLTSFDNFLTDMGMRPAGHTLDRIQPEGHYEPGNCRWATPRQQTLNRRTSRLIEWRGAAVLLADVARMERLPRTSLGKHYRRLGCMEAAVSETRAHLKA